jgi:hypothetical protein
MESLSKEMLERLVAVGSAGKIPEGLAGQYLDLVFEIWKTEDRDIILRGAPHLLLTSTPMNVPCPVQDIHIALATFELAAASHGLGTLWNGMFMMALAACPDLLERLGIPSDQ